MLIIGNHVSPYARKVLVALALKGVAHEIDPIIPFYGTGEFTAVSPLRRIPVLIEGDLVLNDSTVICEYLDETYPEPPLMPKGAVDRARARWLEEYADSRLGDLIIWRLFYNKVIAPYIFKTEPDAAALARVCDDTLPAALDWIETQAPAEDFLFGHLCMADIAYASFFRNALLAGWTIDAARWPRTAAWIGRVEAVPAFADSIRLEQVIVNARGSDRREALRAAGVPVSDRSYGGDAPQASLMLDRR